MISLERCNEKINLNNVVFLYIIIQPILDILTSLHENEGIFMFSFGVVFRSLFIAVAVCISLYEILKGKKYLYLTWIVSVFIYNICYLIHMFLRYDLSIFLVNLSEMVKNYYFVFLLIFFVVIYNKLNIPSIRTAIFIVANIYTLSILIAIITNTSYPAYRIENTGNVGWFYAANELAGIFAVLVPIVLCYMLNSTKNKILMYILCICAVVCSNILGIRTPYIAMKVYLILLFVWNIIVLVIDKRNKLCYNKKTCLKSLLQIVVLLIVSESIYNISYTKNNMDSMVDNVIKIEFEQKDSIEETTGYISDTTVTEENNVIGKASQTDEENNSEVLIPKEIETVENKKGVLWEKINQILHNRLTYIEPRLSESGNVSFGDKLLGSGYVYDVDGQMQTKKIEMDFIDSFFSHGYLGFVVNYAPVIYMLLFCIYNFVRTFKENIRNLELCTYLYTMLLVILVSMTAGHVLVSPAVSIYVVLAYILQKPFYN